MSSVILLLLWQLPPTSLATTNDPVLNLLQTYDSLPSEANTSNGLLHLVHKTNIT